jgi:molybdopterin synthase sulfur carrier subunit
MQFNRRGFSPLKVKVRYFTTLRELAQRAEEEFELEDSVCLGDLIEIIVSKYGNEARQYLYSNEDQRIVDPSIRFLIFGKDSKMIHGLKTQLKDGDTIAIIPPIGGG